MKTKISIILILLPAAISLAQTENILVPTDLKQQTIVTEPATLRKGFLRTGIVTSYSYADKIFDADKKKNYLFESAWVDTWNFTFLAMYGITDRLMVEAWIPYMSENWNYSQLHYSPATDEIIDNSWALEARGLSDVSILASYQLLTEEGGRPSLLTALSLTIPTGEKNPTNIESASEYDLPTGYGAFAVEFDLKARKINYPYSYSAFLFYTYNLPGSKIMYPTDTQETDFTWGNNIQLGGSFNFHLNEWIAVANELNYFFSGKGEQENVPSEDLYTKWAVSYEARLVFQIKRARMGQAIRLPIKGKNASADPLFLIIAQYTF